MIGQFNTFTKLTHGEAYTLYHMLEEKNDKHFWVIYDGNNRFNILPKTLWNTYISPIKGRKLDAQQIKGLIKYVDTSPSNMNELTKKCNALLFLDPKHNSRRKHYDKEDERGFKWGAAWQIHRDSKHCGNKVILIQKTGEWDFFDILPDTFWNRYIGGLLSYRVVTENEINENTPTWDGDFSFRNCYA